MDDASRADKLRNARKKLHSFRTRSPGSISDPCPLMEKPNAQSCTIPPREEKIPAWQPTGTHKRARSRHIRTGSSTAGGEVQGVRIRGVEPWGGSWTVGGASQVTEDAQGIALPDFPVFGGSETQRKGELPVDGPTWGKTGSERPSRKAELAVAIPLHSNPSIPSVAIVPSTPCSTSPSTAFTFPTVPAEEEEGRLRGFTFGRREAASADPPPPLIPSNPTRKKRHSHTRSTSISTRASIVPASPTTPDETPLSTADERRKTLSTLEGRTENGDSWGGVKDVGRAQRRRSRVSIAGERVEIALPAMEDSEDEAPEEAVVDHGAFRIPLATSPNPLSPMPTPFQFPPPSTTLHELPSLAPMGLGAGLPLGSLTASTSMASQATNLGTLIEEDEDLAPERVRTPDRAATAIASPPSGSNPSFKIRPLRLVSMSSTPTAPAPASVSSVGTDALDRDSGSIGSRRSLSFEAASPVGFMRDAKRFSRRPSPSISTSSAEGKRYSTTSSDSRVLHDVEDVETRDSEKGTSVVADLRRLVEQLEMEKQTMQEDIEGWQARCHSLEMQLKHEKEQGVFLRERVRKLGDHLSSISGMTSPPMDAPVAPRSPSTTPQLALMRTEIFKLTTTLAQLDAEKKEATGQVEALRAELREHGRSGGAAARAPAVEAEEEAFAFPEYTSPSPVRTREAVGDDAHRIRAFAFPRGPVAAASPPAAPPKPVSPVKPTYGFNTVTDTSADFQLPAETQLEYGGYAKDLPRGFTMAAPLRCINFENTCGSCRGKVFVL